MLSKISSSAKQFIRSTKRFSSFQQQQSINPVEGGLYQEPTLVEKLNLLKEENIPITASGRQIYDLALILNGGFNPVNSFMNEQEYNSVVHDFRMPDGQLFSIPIYFDIDAQTKLEIERTGKPLLIQDEQGNKIAFLHATEIYKLNKQEEAQHVYGGDKDHCEIININENIKEFAVAGRIQVLDGPQFPSFVEGFTKGPQEVKQIFQEKGWDRIVAFQTRNPMHYAHIELTKRAQDQLGAALYLNPVIGPTKPGDIDASTRMKCYNAIISDYPQDRILLNTLPLAMRMGGPREAMMHAIIRRNYGCTDFIVGRDHAGPGSNSAGEDIYDAFAARDFVVENQKEIGINACAFDEMVYVEAEKKYFPKPELNGRQGLKLSGTEVRRRLGTGEEIPAWFSNPKVVEILRENAFQKKLAAMNQQAESETPAQLIKKALEMYGNEIAISFSGAEDVLLIEYAKQSGLPFRVFSLDTGRLHPETYDYFERVEKHYGIKIEYTFPNTERVKNLVNEKGMFSFYEDGHKECCTIRKVEPLKEKLGTLKAWITGIRKDQSQTRTEIDMVSVDPSFKGAENGPLVKFNPLTNASSQHVWSEITENSVPFNDLHLKGYVSIGCGPCTKATRPGQHEREGRWWWEDTQQKECGLHAAKGSKQ